MNRIYQCDNLEEPLWQSGRAHINDCSVDNVIPLYGIESSTLYDKDEMVRDNFLYHMQIPEITNSTNIIIDSLNIKSIRNQF